MPKPAFPTLLLTLAAIAASAPALGDELTDRFHCWGSMTLASATLNLDEEGVPASGSLTHGQLWGVSVTYPEANVVLGAYTADRLIVNGYSEDGVFQARLQVDHYRYDPSVRSFPALVFEDPAGAHGVPVRCIRR
jgi:hypothetical protein